MKMNLEEVNTVAKKKYKRTHQSKDKKSMHSIEKYVLRWGAHLHIPDTEELRTTLSEVLSKRTGDSVAHCKERLEFFYRLVTNERKRER